MPNSFYDDLAPFYHLLYPDWDAAIAKQADVLHALLQSLEVPSAGRLLDSACGIGTQTIGLAAKGYRVDASDLSAAAVERLSLEAVQRGIAVRSYVDDLRSLAGAKSESMDAVIACDNSLPHLLSDGDLLAAFQSALRVLKPSGTALYSIRDYATIRRVTPEVRPYGLRYQDGQRFVAVQVWEWDADQYDLRMYLTRESSAGACSTNVIVTRYYAVTIERLMRLMADAGFEHIERHDDVFFQPVVVGRKPPSRHLNQGLAKPDQDGSDF